MKHVLLGIAAILTTIGLAALVISLAHPKFLFVMLPSFYGAYKLVAYTNKKYSALPAKW